jgi:hypothetical protein
MPSLKTNVKNPAAPQTGKTWRMMVFDLMGWGVVGLEVDLGRMDWQRE